MAHFKTPILTLALLTCAAPAAADVTPADVWANQGAIFQAMGGALSATLRQDPDGTTATDIRGEFALPMGLGTIGAAIGDIALIDTGDGAVTMRYSADTEIKMSFDIPAAGTGSVTLVLLDAYDQIATGNPGDVTYAFDVPELRMEVTALEVAGPAFEAPDMAMFRDASVDGTVTVNGTAGTMQVTEGDLLALAFDSTVTGQVFDFTFSTGDGIVAKQSGSTGAVDFDMQMMLPSGGTGVMALPAALRDGMSIALQSAVADNASKQTVMIGEELIQSQSDFTQHLDMTIQVDADGFRTGGTADGITVNFLDQMVLPFPIDVGIGSMGFAIEFPLLASDQPLPFVFRLGLGQVALPETIWSMVDPGNALPRDPADLNLDLSGMMGTEVDLLDFEALAALEDAETVPFSIHELTIADLLLAAAGASLSGNGAFTFDMSDLETFEGLPAPTGALDLTLVGGNGLIDKLVAMGLLPEDQAMGARMMMGLFARPGDGEDTLTSKIEIDGATGAISANGQRLQ